MLKTFLSQQQRGQQQQPQQPVLSPRRLEVGGTDQFGQPTTTGKPPPTLHSRPRRMVSTTHSSGAGATSARSLNTLHPAPPVANKSNSTATARRTGGGARSPTRDRRGNDLADAASALSTAKLRQEEELLEVFRQRRIKFEEALGRISHIANAFSDATEFLPRDQRVTIKSLTSDGHPMEQPVAMYHLKPMGRDVQVFDDSDWVEDPFLLDDVDAEEHAALNDLVKKRNGARGGDGSEGSSSMALTSSRPARSATMNSSSNRVVNWADSAQQAVDDDNDVLSPTDASSSSPSSGGGKTSTMTEENAAHPSEVARKRRIIRKLWMGNVIHLRDLYASKAGGFHNMKSDSATTGGGAVRPPIEFHDEHADNADKEGGIEIVDDGGEGGGGHGSGSAAHGGTKRLPFDMREIPPTPHFSSRSLAWIAEGVCHDMNSITHGTENMLRYAMNTHTRRAGILDSEIQRCGYLTRKAIKWCQDAQEHALQYEGGENLVAGGIVAEMTIQRKQVVTAHEELSVVQKQVDDLEAQESELRNETRLIEQRNAVLQFAVDERARLDINVRESGTIDVEAMLRLRQLLHTVVFDMSRQGSSASQRRKGGVPPNKYGVPPTAMQMKDIETSAQKVVEKLTARYGGGKSMDLVARFVMATRGAVRRRLTNVNPGGGSPLSGPSSPKQ